MIDDSAQRGAYCLMMHSTPKIVGILNLHPDSLADVGRQLDVANAVTYAEQLYHDGAAIIDIGAEPTNPRQNESTSEIGELQRLLPVLDALKGFPIPLSVDTSRPEVMYEAAARGVTMINDVRALRIPGALEAVAELKISVCLMHMAQPFLGQPVVVSPLAGKAFAEYIRDFLLERVQVCLAMGISASSIILDPGFGHGAFGKNLQQNLDLLRYLDIFTKLNFPILVGLSRKTFIGELLGIPIEERLPASVAAAMLAAIKGASYLRVHDVKATVEALKLTTTVMF